MSPQVRDFHFSKNPNKPTNPHPNPYTQKDREIHEDKEKKGIETAGYLPSGSAKHLNNASLQKQRLNYCMIMICISGILNGRLVSDEFFS